MRTSVSWKGTLRASCRDLWVCSPAGNKIPPKDSIWSSRGESHRCPVRVRSSLSLIATWPRPLGTVCEDALPSVCSWDSGCAGTFCHSFSVDEDKEMLPRVYIFIKELTENGALLWFKCCSNIIYSRKEKQKVLSHCDGIPAMLFYLFLMIFDVKTCWEHRDRDHSHDRAAFTMQDNYHKMCHKMCLSCIYSGLILWSVLFPSVLQAISASGWFFSSSLCDSSKFQPTTVTL